MGKSREEVMRRRTGGSSSSSSSDFEFTVSVSPSSKRSSTSRQCPADELFYKGQILPLHLSPRISMLRSLLLSSASSADTTTTASRDSNGSSSSSYSYSSSSATAADLLLLLPECDSSRPSSVTEEEEAAAWSRVISPSSSSAAKRGKYFSSLANRFSSVFISRGGGGGCKKNAPSTGAAAAAMDLDAPPPPPTPTGKRANSTSTAKQVIKKYVSKVKPLYEKLKSQGQSQGQKKKFFPIRKERDVMEEEEERSGVRGIFMNDDESHSFSGNLSFPARGKRCTGSCLSSMRSTPTHSGPLDTNGAAGGFPADDPPAPLQVPSPSSPMEELQSAIQGAIAHCKSTMAQPRSQEDLLNAGRGEMTVRRSKEGSRVDPSVTVNPMCTCAIDSNDIQYFVAPSWLWTRAGLGERFHWD